MNVKNYDANVSEKHKNFPTMYWIPKLHKNQYKARFIANSCACTTKLLSQISTSCLSKIKEHAKFHCEKAYGNSGKNLFWSIKKSGEVLNKLKCKDFHVSTVSSYDFSTLNTSLPHTLIKKKLVSLIEGILGQEQKTC